MPRRAEPLVEEDIKNSSEFAWDRRSGPNADDPRVGYCPRGDAGNHDCNWWGNQHAAWKKCRLCAVRLMYVPKQHASGQRRAAGPLPADVASGRYQPPPPTNKQKAKAQPKPTTTRAQSKTAPRRPTTAPPNKHQEHYEHQDHAEHQGTYEYQEHDGDQAYEEHPEYYEDEAAAQDWQRRPHSPARSQQSRMSASSTINRTMEQSLAEMAAEMTEMRREMANIRQQQPASSSTTARPATRTERYAMSDTGSQRSRTSAGNSRTGGTSRSTGNDFVDLESERRAQAGRR